MTDRYAIGDMVNLSIGPESEIIGIDRYICNTYAGQRRVWTSYTLEADQPAPFDRWYATDEDEGLFYWCVTEPFKPTGILQLQMSGLCKLHSEGDNTLASPYSSVLVFRTEEMETPYSCVEAFEGNASLLHFRGAKINKGTAEAKCLHVRF